jgi:CBS domain-containing protein
MEIRAFKELMELELRDHFLVEDALTPLKYRIYPDTPLLEVVDLMVRRELRAVPVVGESYEVLGIVTVGDALKHLIPRARGGDESAKVAQPPRALSARDVMTRTVLCVSEDQSLLEAANLMVNRDVEQLPVVREGELIGFLTRDAILRILFGREDGVSTET